MHHPPGRTLATIVGRVPADPASPAGEHLVSVVIPIYQAEHQLPSVVADLLPLTEHVTTPGGVPFRVTEVLLVHDCGPDDSASVMRRLASEHSVVRPIWLSRNFGQHAATLAGMSSSGGDWIVTMDEDGQHDPSYVGAMLDVALEEQVSVVYARPTNEAPHGGWRNATSSGAKRLVTALSGGTDATVFNSYRLVLGEVGRSVGAYAGAGVFLDVALGWVAGAVTTAPVELRAEGEGRRSGYTTRTLLSHFWRMVLTGGTRGLRLVSVLGLVFALLGLVIAAFVAYRQLVHPAPTEGWTSLIVVMLISTGAILFSLGVIAEYVGVAVNMAMGKPLYLITQDPADGPLGRPRPARLPPVRARTPRGR
jgi:glycosyltransferase involved in cell wall biosynthesis